MNERMKNSSAGRSRIHWPLISLSCTAIPQGQRRNAWREILPRVREAANLICAMLKEVWHVAFHSRIQPINPVLAFYPAR